MLDGLIEYQASRDSRGNARLLEGGLYEISCYRYVSVKWLISSLLYSIMEIEVAK